MDLKSKQKYIEKVENFFNDREKTKKSIFRANRKCCKG